MLRARQIRDELKGQVDPKVGKMLVLMAEDIHTLNEQLITLAQLFDRMCDQMNTMMGVALTTQKSVDAVKKIGLPEGSVQSEPTKIGGAS